MKFQKQKGTQDILPAEQHKWQYISDTAEDILNRYGFYEIKTPIFEAYELFHRGIGESSDVVSKEMYDFFDKGERHIALRPEGTASVVRAYIENKLYGPEHIKPQKFFYNGPMFRYENPQSGRQRQFHQLGVEVFGSESAQTDVETMALAVEWFKELGLKNIELVVNSIGDGESRKAYREALVEYLTPYQEELSEDSKTRLVENPLRILDSKNPKDQEIVENAPSVLDFLSEESKEHFNEVISLLDALEISYHVDHRMVRGLDYYTDTVFEIMTDDQVFGSITTICAGGRYDNLVEEMGGPKTPAFGFAAGMERIVLTMDAQDIPFPEASHTEVFVVGIGDVALETFKITQTLRKQGLAAEKDIFDRKPKGQFKAADRSNANYVLVLGPEELENGEISLRNMSNGEQKKMPLADIYTGAFVEELFEYL